MIVVNEKVSVGSEWVRAAGRGRSCTDGKVFAPGVCLESRSGVPVRSPKNTSGDKRLARLISHIHFTSEYKQQYHAGNTTQQCRL